ncbi:MAG TPA: hypothetical protein VGJ33_06740 [Candidatus Angelobacter sp.]|jgi:hypothetical protein
MSSSPAISNRSKHGKFTPSSAATVIAIALIAYAADDTVHEALGHGTACLLFKIKMLRISSVGLQTAESSRAVAAAGAIANVFAGVASLLLAARQQRFSPWSYFVWLFGFINLMNGTGYLMASALLGSGDWYVVIAGLNPPLAWRAGMGLLGVILFAFSVRWAASIMAEKVYQGSVDHADLSRLTVPTYLAGGILFVAASALNPYSPGLILVSGAGASFGLTFGLLLVPGMVKNVRVGDSLPANALELNWGWVVFAVLVAGIFIGVFGRGIALS